MPPTTVPRLFSRTVSRYFTRFEHGVKTHELYLYNRLRYRVKLIIFLHTLSRDQSWKSTYSVRIVKLTSCETFFQYIITSGVETILLGAPQYIFTHSFHSASHIPPFSDIELFNYPLHL